MKVILLALTVLSLSGCASLERFAGPGWADRADADPEQGFTLAEGAWHTLNVVDTAQTLHIASAPECHSEADPLTRTIIGRHPDKSSAVAIGAAYSLAVHYIGRWLRRKDASAPDSGWHEARVGFAIVTLGTKTLTVARNHSSGLRPFGSGCP